MKKFLFISLLFIALSTFFSSKAEAQNTVRLRSEASVTFTGISIFYSTGWSENVLPLLGEDYLMSSTSIDIPLSSGGRWDIKLWDGSNMYLLELNIDDNDSITYITLTDSLLREIITD